MNQKTPHHKAFEYNYFFTDKDGNPAMTRNYIAIVPGVDIEILVRRWNMAAKLGNHYELVSEVPLEKALTQRSTSGATILSDYKLLDHMQYHSISF